MRDVPRRVALMELTTQGRHRVMPPMRHGTCA